MLKLHFYNHKTLCHLKKQSFYHCCKCCLCKAYSPDTFQTHLVNHSSSSISFANEAVQTSMLDRGSLKCCTSSSSSASPKSDSFFFCGHPILSKIDMFCATVSSRVFDRSITEVFPAGRINFLSF